MALVIVPSIDLRAGKVVRLAQGDYARQTQYDVEPKDVAAAYKKAGAVWMHVVDLDGAKDGRSAQAGLIAEIAAASGLRVQAGGGIRSTADIDRLLSAGVERVVVGTKAMEDWKWFEELVHGPSYKGKLILALDAKDGMVATRAWTETSTQSAVDVARKVSGWPLAAILYTDVAKDGMLQGPNLTHTRLLADAGTVPVIASGGVGNLSHITELRSLPVWGVIVGRALYEGKVDLAEAIRVAGAT